MINTKNLEKNMTIIKEKEQEKEEEDDDLEWEEWNPHKISFINHMFAGSIAGVAEHVCLYPIDTVKTFAQCQKCGVITPAQTWSCANQIVKHDGLVRLWRGVTAMFAGCIPAHAAFFSIFEFCKKTLGADTPEHTPIRSAISGGIATLSHDFIITPFDTIKQRMQLGYYKNIIHCTKEIIRSESIFALYVSFPTTFFMNIPHGALVVSINESIKKFLNPQGGYNLPVSIIAGCTAGGLAALITNPLDVIKTRIQVQNMVPCTEQNIITTTTTTTTTAEGMLLQGDKCLEKKIYLQQEGLSPHLTRRLGVKDAFGEVLEATSNLFRKEGIVGFYRGAFPRMLSQAPAVAISWSVYESAKYALQRYSPYHL